MPWPKRFGPLAAAALFGSGILLGLMVEPLGNTLRDAARPLVRQLRGVPPPPHASPTTRSGPARRAIW
jgi:hypothetical protein